MKRKEQLESELKNLREEIDSLDRLILATLKTRFKLTAKIARIKTKLQIPLYQKARWEAILEDRIKRAEKMGLRPEFILAFLKLIHKESIRSQKLIQREVKK